MTATEKRCQNGWPVLGPERTGRLPRLRAFTIPGKPASSPILLRDGSAGFVLVHMAAWWHDAVEPLTGKVLDDWGYAVRPVRGQTTGYSNHAGGTAEDLNATKHPRGVPLLSTFTKAQVHKIRHRLELYDGVIRWGGDYKHSPVDGMHLEIVEPLTAVERVARSLLDSPRGVQVLHANPGLRQVVLS